MQVDGVTSHFALNLWGELRNQRPTHVIEALFCSRQCGGDAWMFLESPELSVAEGHEQPKGARKAI